MKCEYCDNEIPAGVSRCPSCGAVVKQVNMPQNVAPVASVQQQVAPSVVASGTPGVQVVINNAAPVSPYAPPPPIIYKTRKTFVLLGVFLGCFGIHNFYAGYAGRGVSQLLLSLILLATPVYCIPVYLWALFEIAFVTEDARAVRMI